MKAIMLAIALAVCSSGAAGASYAWFDRPDAASANSHAAVSNDVYVRGFGWAWGDLQLSPDTPGGDALPPPARHARDSLRRHDIVPWRQPDESGPRPARGKISMNLASGPADTASGGFAGGTGAGRPLRVVR
ncbi:hypothetical protein BJN34_35165 [Cupriavidus necator]|uniref:Uncharacterized protein n=1 Tax=Cupriavidus necator TaxID=106590 RepID=A0A1U9V3N6_CUPNE|nr:hypothetical protein [Cupriavidus necator]AQV99121.1 hypothetical protein BJN34_35165 [Cupriavidus necator]